MKKSAGILLYRFTQSGAEVLLVHPGGPFWQHKDLGVWSIPKGEVEANEDLLAAAKRELEEETGIAAPEKYLALSPVKQKSAKIIYAWAAEKDVDASMIKSNNFEMEWPPKSGVMKSFPEIDKAAWFNEKDALEKIVIGQTPFVLELIRRLRQSS